MLIRDTKRHGLLRFNGQFDEREKGQDVEWMAAKPIRKARFVRERQEGGESQEVVRRNGEGKKLEVRRKRL